MVKLNGFLDSLDRHFLVIMQNNVLNINKIVYKPYLVGQSVHCCNKNFYNCIIVSLSQQCYFKN